MTSTTETAPVPAADVKTADPAAGDNAVDNATDAKPEPSPKKAEPKPQVHKVDFEKDVVYLYGFPRTPTIPSLSPYCLKVETFLRVAGIKYENVDNKVRYKSKKGQLPFVELNGEEIADSDIILRELSKKFEKNLNAGLTAEQQSQSTAFESMLNNHTGWVVRRWRAANPDDFLTATKMDLKATFGSRLPKPLLNVLFRYKLSSNMNDVVGHGIGRHSAEEVVDSGKADLSALSAFLGSKDYFFGKDIHQLDITAFAHLAQFIYVPFEGMKEWIEAETPNLLKLVERIRDKYWTDWDDALKTLELNTHLPKKELTPEQIEEQKKAEEKKAEEARKKEEKKKEKEEKKKQKEEEKRKAEEEKRKAKEEKERLKKEAAEAKAKAAAEKAEKEKAEKEKAEKEKKEAEAKADDAGAKNETAPEAAETKEPAPEA